MVRKGKVYTLTYDDSKLPSHYGWKIDSRLPVLDRQYSLLKRNNTAAKDPSPVDLERQVRDVIKRLDNQGRWITIYRGESLVGQPKFKLKSPYISSAVFSRNLELFSDYLLATKTP